MNKERVWKRFAGNAVATDEAEAVFLAGFVKDVEIKRIFLRTIEVADLQHYRLLKAGRKVDKVLSVKKRDPFVFVLHKN
jgi:hypothetical protein